MRESSVIDPTPCTRPSARTATRSVTCHNRSRSCVIMTMLRPNKSRSLSTNSSTPAALSGSSPAVGSSRNSSSGSSASARARDARFIMPPLSSPGYWAPTSGLSPAMASFQFAISSIKASPSWVCSRSGSPTFSSTVSDPNKPPCWNITPQRWRSARASTSEIPCRSTPSTRTEPEVGCCSRIISRSSVDLPEPLPPTTAKISLRRTSRSRSECTTWSPKRVDSLLISMIVSRAGAGALTSEIQHTEGNREQGVGDDHQEDRLHHAAGGLAADAVGAALRAKTLKTAHERDDGGEHGRLANADQIRGDAHGLDEAVEKLAKAHTKLRARHQHAAEHAKHIGKHGEQWQHDHQRDDLGQHQQFQRRNTQGAHGINLLGHGHGADLRGVSRAGPPGDDDRGDQGRKLAQHRQAHQVGHKNVGAVLSELVRTLVGDHNTQQQRQQPDNRQRVESGTADVEEDRTPAQSRRVRDAGGKDRCRFTHETKQRHHLFSRSSRTAAYERKPGRRRLGERRGSLAWSTTCCATTSIICVNSGRKPRKVTTTPSPRRRSSSLCNTQAPDVSSASTPVASAITEVAAGTRSSSSCGSRASMKRAAQHPDNARSCGVDKVIAAGAIKTGCIVDPQANSNGLGCMCANAPLPCRSAICYNIYSCRRPYIGG